MKQKTYLTTLTDKQLIEHYHVALQNFIMDMGTISAFEIGNIKKELLKRLNGIQG